MNFSNTFTPYKIGNLMIKNRLTVPAMDSGVFSPEGYVAQSTLDYYGARAAGGFGLIIIEIAAVEKRGVGMPHEPNVWSDDAIEGLTKLANCIKNKGARTIVQLHHAGRETVSAMAGEPIAAPSSVPCPTNRETPHEFTTQEVYDLIRHYVEAAVRCRKAGFDGVEIHAAHGYMGGQFLSPRSNKRVDEFGGGLDGRAYFMKLVAEGIREACGDDFVITARISSKENRIGGLEIEESVVFAQMLEDYGYDALHISAGTYETWQTIVPPSSWQSGWNLGAARRIKEAVDIPVISVGLFHDPYTIETALKRGDCDVVSLGRQSICDPDFPNKMYAGVIEDIIPCLGCTQRCMEFNYPENLMPGDWGVGCMLNPESSHRADRLLTPTDRPKNVVVVGAGPAGLATAYMAAGRGHKVTLLEKNPASRVGGQFLIAAYPPFKQGLTKAIRYQLHMCRKNGVDLRFDTEADPDMIRELHPDVLVMATGAQPLVPEIKGIHDTGVVLANDVLLGSPVLKSSALIIGGGEVGVETAEYATDYCTKVSIVEMLPELAEKLYLTVRNDLLKRLKEEEVDVHCNTKVLEFIPGGVIAECGGERITLDGYDHVILALGSRSYVPFDPEGLAPEVYTVGDAVKARDAKWAIYEGYRTAQKI
ncbi:MAG TPA: NAD(P)/FAD-dependent oxidoreductase [Candidatus Mediterraneibacter stercoravium]|uniref:NAD(P)/FAD-dependent oxidoreductase n=1 Tax=Candidatus Mediterraneibacter stercoravium TaxID=2838685 RepID=A0A9D2G7R5_9FIRM|nr:NAD(P)/FAD-dependent oxidoreductase [Candidatus Mediterraneibacter stercoravium]